MPGQVTGTLTGYMLTTGFLANATYPKQILYKSVSIVRQALRDACLAPITTSQIFKEQY